VWTVALQLDVQCDLDIFTQCVATYGESMLVDNVIIVDRECSCERANWLGEA
jgi:hypothetical protein